MPCKDFMISNNNHMDSFKVVTQVAHTWWGGPLQEQQKDNHHKQWYQTTITRPVLHKQQDYKSRFTYSLYPIFIGTTTATSKLFFFFFWKTQNEDFLLYLLDRKDKIQYPHESRDAQQQHRRGGRRRGKGKHTPTLFISQSLWTP